MEYGNIDEETIVQRLLYKEKPDLNSLAHKCIDLEKIDYSKIRPSQRDELITALQEDLNSLEQYTEKQSVLHDMYLKELSYHTEKQNTLSQSIADCTEHVKKMMNELENEKNKRINLLEYEKYAKDINSLPKKEQSQHEISSIEKEIAHIRNKRQEKEVQISEIEICGAELIRQIKEMMRNTEDLLS